MKKKLLLLGILVLFMTGCLSEKDKIELISNELDNKYNSFEMIDNYSYSNENGDNELYSIIKVDDDYELVYSNFDNDKLNKYEEVKVNILEYNKDDRFIEANVYNNGEYLKQDNVLIFDTSKLSNDEIKKIVFNKAMNQYMADLKDNNITINLKVRFASSLSNNMDTYKKIILADFYSRCSSKFYDKYHEDANIIGGGFSVLVHSASREISYDEIKTSIEEDFDKLDENYNYVRK